jgi:hypothetical protein
MIHLRAASRRLTILLVILSLGLTPALAAFPPAVAYAQDLSADPKAVSPTPADLRVGFQLVPEKSEQREPVPGIIVYEADFVRDQTPQNFANGPIEVKSLVAKTANSQQAAEQFTSSRQALTTASPPWVESKVAKLGDEATGLSMQGTSSAGPAVAHLFLFRRGAMVVGITVAGLEKPTRMAEAEAIAASTLRKIDPQFAAQTGPQRARPLNSQGAQTQRPASGSQPAANTSNATTPPSSGGGQRLRVANTGGTGVRLRTGPSRTARIAGVLPEGTTLEVVGPDAQGDGLTWKNVRAPGDGRGYVAADYTAPVSGSASSGAPTTATTTNTSSPTTAASSQTRTNTAASAPASTTASAPASTSPSVPASSTSADALKVDVGVKSNDLKAGEEQTVSVTVTKNGQPVSGAQVTVKTSPTGETPAAPATDGSGKTSVTWKPTGAGGFIGVGVSVLTSDGNAGVGGASFRLT